MVIFFFLLGWLGQSFNCQLNVDDPEHKRLCRSVEEQWSHCDLNLIQCLMANYDQPKVCFE